jgi:hypothetical protein
LLEIGTRDTPAARAVATNFAVVRVKRDILRRSSIGAILTARSAAQNRPGSNEAYGIDGTFAFFQNLSFNTYWAKTHSEGLVGDDSSFRAQLDYAGDRYGEFQNSDRFSVAATDSHEFLKQPFAIIPTVSIPVGAYDFRSARVVYTLGQQRPFSGLVSTEHGTFYDGHLTTMGFSRTRVNLTSRFSLEPTISINWVDLPYGSFTTKLVGSRVTYTMTPLMFASALIQYNSSTNRVSTNLRLRWEYQPGSELFVVYNDERGTLTPRSTDLQNRAFIIKVNRLFRF